MKDSLDVLSVAYEDSITHYGVMGMKWGHRKQYAQSQGLTSRQVKRQIKDDNRKAFELGRNATISERASTIAEKRLAKAQAKHQKKQTSKTELRLKRAEYVNQLAKERVQKARAAMKSHRESLVSKYGDTKVSAIKKDKYGRTNEKVNTTGTHVAAAIASFGSIAAARALHIPFAVIYSAPSKNSLASNAYGDMMDEAVKKYR